MLRLISARLSPLAVALAAPPAAAALAAAADPDAAYAAAQAPLRLARSVSTAVSVASDYKRTQARMRRGKRESGGEGGGEGGEGLTASTSSTSAEQEAAAERELRACHRRGASRLRDLCYANGGIYIKLGQHLATLDHLLPEEYVSFSFGIFIFVFVFSPPFLSFSLSFFLFSRRSPMCPPLSSLRSSS